MKKIICLCIILFTIQYINAQNNPQLNKNTVKHPAIPFDNNWLFTIDTATNAQQAGYNDTRWRKVDLPHDWSVEDLPNQVKGDVAGPFSKSSIGKGSTGFTVGGIGWYRKKFMLGKTYQNKYVSILFDGVYMNSDVWLNGKYLGNHPYGYTPFYYDLTPYLKSAMQENVLVVKVRNEGQNSRWYSGSGIYRHVWLIVTGPIHLAPLGVCITTPIISKDKTTVQIKSTLSNEQSSNNTIGIVTTIRSPDGKIAGRKKNIVTFRSEASKIDSQSITLSHPLLWSVETPHLYKAVIQIKSGNKIIYEVETSFGIRSLRIDTSNGLTINGNRVLLKGGCIHHDNGPLGAVTIDRAEERKIEILKKNGFNAIRLSHNPPSKQLLDACDRLGMLVIDEAFDMWERPKNPQDYHRWFKDWWRKDLEAMILRDRNHPSVIFWSIGNEINERADSTGLQIEAQLVSEVKHLDSTRFVTEAICEFWEHPGLTWEASAPAFKLLDAGGYNYQWQMYVPDHRQYPTRIIMGTESFPKEALENWNMAEKHRYVLGDFVWTAFDYMGEASIGHAFLDSTKKKIPSLGWPWFNAWCGDIDIIGQKKPQSFYRDVVWRQRPIAMAVHAPIPNGLVESVSNWGWPLESQSWTWPGAESKPLQVRVFSRAPMVRLLLNGNVTGEKKLSDSSITAVFEVPYQAGILKAINIENGKETSSVELKTTGAPKHIRLIADRTVIKASRNDLSYVTVEVVDENNQVVPMAEIPVHFSISGAGELAAVGNANPTDMESFQQPTRKTFMGRCLAIIRPTEKGGAITLKATAKGLTEARVVITAH